MTLRDKPQAMTGVISGLNVMRIINEPTVVAICVWFGQEGQQCGESHYWRYNSRQQLMIPFMKGLIFTPPSQETQEIGLRSLTWISFGGVWVELVAMVKKKAITYQVDEASPKS